MATSWVSRFARDEGRDLRLLTHHYYHEGHASSSETGALPLLPGFVERLQESPANKQNLLDCFVTRPNLVARLNAALVLPSPYPSRSLPLQSAQKGSFWLPFAAGDSAVRTYNARQAA